MEKVYSIKNLKNFAFSEKFAPLPLLDHWPKYYEIMEKFAKKFPKVRSVMYTHEILSTLPERLKPFK